MQQTKKGFTLIELLVVIAIIGILSAIGLVSLNGARERARDAKRKSDLAQISTALSLYYDDNSSVYPTQAAAALVSTALTGLVPTYVQVLPTPDSAAGPNSYWYISNSATLTDASVDYAANKVFGLATTLEGGTKDWFIINTLGYAKNKATTIAMAAASTSTTSATIECSTTPGAGHISICKSAP